MKTNTIKTALVTAAITSIALIAITKDSVSFLSVLAVIVSYTAVALIAGLATMDYSTGPKAYGTR